MCKKIIVKKAFLKAKSLAFIIIRLPAIEMKDSDLNW